MRTLRKMGNRIFYVIWGFICDIIALFLNIYKVALSSKKKKYRLKTRALSSIISAGLTSMIMVKLISGSFIWTAIQYAFASIQKHFAIGWAADGDWVHWMTGGRYNFFEGYKEYLISSNSSAKTLNDLANTGIFGKIIQITLIILSVAVMVYLAYVIIKSLKNFFWSVKMMHYRKEKAKHARRSRTRHNHHNHKVIYLKDYQNRKHA